MRNLMNITDLSLDEIDELIATAEDIIANPEKYQEADVRRYSFFLNIPNLF